MELNKLSLVGEVVKNNIRTAQIFNRNRIDYSCRGGISINEACDLSDIDADVLIEELERVFHHSDPDTQYINSLELDELYNYIITKHHVYVVATIPFLKEKIDYLCRVYGNRHQELYEIKDVFMIGAQSLSMHLIKEEQMLFKYIQHLVDYQNGDTNVKPDGGKANNMIVDLTINHTTEGDYFSQIASLTSNYTCPFNSCDNYRITYQTLNEFEKDLQRHIHLENNILYKKVIEMEAKLINEMRPSYK